MAEDTYGLGGPVKGGREVAPLKILVFAYFTLAFSNGQNRIPDLESSEDFGLYLSRGSSNNFGFYTMDY